MKLTSRLIAFVIAASGFASAASITVGNLIDMTFTVDPLIVTDPLFALDNTFTAKIGFLADGTILTTTDTFATINANWINAGDIVFASGDAAGYAGYFTGEVFFNDAAGLAGKNVFVWATDGADQNAVLFTSQIQFLADGAFPNANSALAIEEANTGAGLYWQPLLGSKVLNPDNADGGGSFHLNNAAIPEPSAALLGAIGALGLMRRRRN